MTEPEQSLPYFQNLWRELQAECQLEGHGAAVELLQRAFEERERKLREENDRLSRAVCSGAVKNLLDADETEALVDFIRELRGDLARQALKETPDAQ